MWNIFHLVRRLFLFFFQLIHMFSLLFVPAHNFQSLCKGLRFCLTFFQVTIKKLHILRVLPFHFSLFTCCTLGDISALASDGKATGNRKCRGGHKSKLWLVCQVLKSSKTLKVNITLSALVSVSYIILTQNELFLEQTVYLFMCNWLWLDVNICWDKKVR